MGYKKTKKGLSVLLTIERVIILKSINLFSEISQSDLLAIATQIQEVSYDPDETIIEQDEFGTSMYIVVRGEVDVIIDNELVTSLGEKSIFGELAALDPEPRSATIKSKSETLVFKIDGEIIYNLIAEYPNVARGIIKILCDRIRQKV